MFRKWFLLLLALAVSTPSFALDEYEEQRAKERGVLKADWGGYAPKGWQVIAATKGGVFTSNGDDAVLIVEETDPAKIRKNDGMGTETLNVNPRHLLILSKVNGRYVVKSRADMFLPSSGDSQSPCLADPLEEDGVPKIQNRVLSINLRYWMSCGSWDVTNREFKFRSEKGRMRLIGIEIWSFHRASGIGSTSSLNYLTRKRKDVSNVIGLGPEPDFADGEKPPKSVTKWTMLPKIPIYLDAMDMAQCATGDASASWCGY
jgi:hypothetical protein